MDMQNNYAVLFVSHKYPPATGGMEKQSYELIRGVAAARDTYTLLYTGQNSRVQFFMRLNRRILDILERYPAIKIIHFNDALIGSCALQHQGYGGHLKVVTVHGLDVVFPLSYYQRHILPRFRAFDHIVAVSQATAAAIIERGVEADKVSVIHNGVDPGLGKALPEEHMKLILQKYPQLKLDQPYLMMLGRPVLRKGFSWFIEQVLPQLSPSTQLVLVGPYQPKKTVFEYFITLLPRRISHCLTLFLGYPTDQVNIRRLMKNYRGGQRILHLGVLPDDDRQALLYYAHAFIMPNIRVEGDMEGFGLVCLEAALAGTTAVASELEGIQDAIHPGKNGILLPTEDSTAWASTLSALLSTAHIHRSAYKSYTQDLFSWSSMCAAYMQLFDRLAATKR